MLKIALTGPSGSGKGYVCSFFEKMGVPCLDADRAVHDLYADRAFANRLCTALGHDVRAEDGTVDRKKLAALVFEDGNLMRLLLSIVYPCVEDRILSFFSKCEEDGRRAAVVDAPQLFEAGLEGSFDAVVCVSAPKRERLRRVMQRDGIDKKAALLRFSHQMGEKEYEKRSDYVLKNRTGDDAGAKVEALLARLEKT